MVIIVQVIIFINKMPFWTKQQYILFSYISRKAHYDYKLLPEWLS